MENKNCFDNYSEELYEGIFKYLDLDDLKSCKKVCIERYSCLKHSETFTKTAITVWYGDQMSTLQYFRNIFGVRRNCIYIIGQAFRLREFSTIQILKLIAYIPKEAFQIITHLEIVNSVFVSYMLQRLVKKFKSLTSLTLSDLFLTNIGLNPTANCTTRIRSSFQNIKVLRIHFKKLLEHEKFRNTITLIGDYFNGLEHLSLNMLAYETNGSSIFFPYLPYECILSAVAKMIQNNTKTLKEVSLDFNIGNDPVSLLNWSKSVGYDKNESFISFLDQLTKYTDWVESGLHLRKLNLGFGLARTDNTKFQQFFLPFLKTQTALQKFSLAQLFIQTNFDFENLLACVPLHCQCAIDTLNLPKKIIFSEEENANSLPEENSDSEDDLKYSSKVIFKTYNIHLTSSFVGIKSIENLKFLTTNIQSLTKINIQQFGVTFSNKFRIIDKDIQNIIGNAIHLTELYLKYCNMNSVTDFGLTGISPDACNRMLTTNNFKLKNDDKIGLAISNLKNLRYLMLDKVENGITDITAHHAFNGLEKLNSFGILKPNMTHYGWRVLKQLFECNQKIQICPQFQSAPYQLSKF